MSNNLFDVDNPLEQDANKTTRGVVVGLGVVAYLIVLLFTAAHSWNLILSAVSDSAVWVAAIGVIALELNAIALPLAIHYWTRTPGHRWAAIVFYAIDIFLLYANSLLDARLISNGTIPPWGNFYLVNFAQVSPLFTLAVWAILFSLDPASRAKEQIQRLVTHAQIEALKKTADYLSSDAFGRQVQKHGDQIGKYVVGKAFSDDIFSRSNTKAYNTDDFDLDDNDEIIVTGNGREKTKSGRDQSFQ